MGHETNWRSTVVRTFKRGCESEKHGRSARRWALQQAVDAILDDRSRKANTVEYGRAFFEDRVADQLTLEQITTAMRAGSAGPGIQRRGAYELERLTAPKKTGPKPRPKSQRDPALATAAELSAALIIYLRARGETERGYAVRYAVACTWALLGERLKSERVHATLRSGSRRNFGKPDLRPN